MLRKEVLSLKSAQQFASFNPQLAAIDEERPKLTKEEMLAQQEKMEQIEAERVKKQNEGFETEFEQQATNRSWSGKTEQLVKTP